MTAHGSCGDKEGLTKERLYPTLHACGFLQEKLRPRRLRPRSVRPGGLPDQKIRMSGCRPPRREVFFISLVLKKTIITCLDESNEVHSKCNKKAEEGHSLGLISKRHAELLIDKYPPQTNCGKTNRAKNQYTETLPLAPASPEIKAYATKDRKPDV